MEILNNFLYKYKNSDFVDIEEIVKNEWVKIHTMDLWKIDWVLYENNIWVNSKLDLFKQRFVIAHEFCHFLLWEKWFSRWIFHSKDPKEKRADEFAMNLLLPKRALLKAYEEYQNIPCLVNIFWVPSEVIEKKLNLIV